MALIFDDCAAVVVFDVVHGVVVAVVADNCNLFVIYDVLHCLLTVVIDDNSIVVIDDGVVFVRARFKILSPFCCVLSFRSSPITTSPCD